MTLARHLEQAANRRIEFRAYAVCGGYAVLGDVVSDFEQIYPALRLNEKLSHPALF